jgi:AhpD family alkylhydroperoxidase
VVSALTPPQHHHVVNQDGLLPRRSDRVALDRRDPLPAAVRERLAISTAQLNGCEYCLSAHTYIGANIAKVDPAELDSARKGQSDDPHVAALLKLSNDIAENAGDVDDADVDAAREAVVTDEEIGELVANLALNILTNYFNVLAHVDNDWPVVSL